MKQIIYTINIILLSLVFFNSCDDSKDDNLTQSKVYIVNSGEQDMTMYDKGEAYIYKLDVYKSGYLNSSGNAKVAVLSESELAKYNAANETDYKLLAPNLYSIKNLDVHFSSNTKDVIQYIDIEFDPSKIKVVEDRSYILPLKIESSNLEINNEKSICIIKPSVKDSRSYFTETAVSKDYAYGRIGDESIPIGIKLDIDKNDYAINYEVEVDQAYIAQYNAANNTKFALLSEKAYVLNSKTVIEVGEKEANFPFEIVGAGLTVGDFMLPLKLKASKFEEDDQLYVLIVKVTAPLLDRKTWTIVDFNTQEANGEGAGNGIPECVLDGKYNTFWHSRWQGGNDPMPHYIVIDMQMQYTLTQIGLVNRQADQWDTRGGEFWMSDDNANWAKVGDFELKASEVRNYPIESTKGRYLKVIITEANPGKNNVTSLAEVFANGFND